MELSKQMMKRFLMILVLGLLLSSKVLATVGISTHGLKGLKEFNLIVENFSTEAKKICGITSKDIERSVKYILSNSKIKLTTKSGTEKIYVQVTMLPAEDYCVGYIAFMTYGDQQEQKNSSGNTFFSTPRSYEARGGVFGSSPNQFKNYLLGIIEDVTKEFVIEWNEQNK